MNNNLIEIITQYLRIETNYAVILNGQYGVGKTHFYKKELSAKIKTISLPKNEQKKFSPIHISLFGFKSLEEIQTAIFVELYPILKNKGLKLAGGVGKSIIRGIAQISQAGDIDKYIGDISQDANDWLNYDELVICFDDLDRKSDSLDLRDVLGFINSLVENQGAKVLIIANEKQLIKDKNYSTNLREKVIGVSIQYTPEPNAVFEQIIQERYSSSDKLYYDFLRKYKSEIVSIIAKNQNNFRNLIFFLEHFKIVFYPIEQFFQEDKDFSVLKNEKRKAILDFTLAISIEYRLGHLNSTNLDDIENIGDNSSAIIDISKLITSSNNQNNEEEDREPSYDEAFRTKYFSESKYYFFKTIFNHITGSKAFDSKLLKKELEDYFIIEEGELPQKEIILQKLGYFDFLKLSNKEYRKLTSEMLSYLDQGLYQLIQYSTIFHFATRFNNLLNYNFDNLKKRCKKGIRKGISNYTYNDDLRLYMSVDSDTEFKNDVIEIIEYCLEINKSLKETKDKNALTNLFELFNTDFDRFIKKVSERDNEYRFSPFWLEFEINKVYQRIKKLENTQIWKLGHYFKNRYRRNIYEKLFPEIKFIQELKQLIDNSTKKRMKKNLQNASFDYLSKCLTNSEGNFPE